ncbi:isochorismate synthase MenF [Kocuria sp. TGY1127_2]|uniref:isochorismate synthase n=1 Tax=Kocuria sp. TGY1127_2 TaxID=2711328 RepID=UPI0015BAF6F5|nr:isochorismate synthase [Kocuria sp. TGY1127_2]
MNPSTLTAHPATDPDRATDPEPNFTFSSGRWTLEASGGEILRPVFAHESGAAGDLMNRLRDREQATSRTQVLYGIIPFDTSEPAELRITGEAAWIPQKVSRRTASAPTTRHTTPDSPHYRRIVSEALDRIELGEMKKIVLSRSMTLPLPGEDRDTTEQRILERLSSAGGRADIFRIRLSDGVTWLGASPEIIADLNDSRFVTHPLAGSLGRSPGGPEADEAARLLGSSPKDMHEHGFVTRHIRDALCPLARELRVPAEPELFGTDSMWHLGTRITGLLKPGVSALEAALAVHPTPAVGGTPAAQAVAAIRQLEGQSRRYYSGLVGWTDSAGNGRWSLVLRCASIQERNITLYAGAGIVQGSTPESEHAETASKFGTVLRTLEGLA